MDRRIEFRGKDKEKGEWVYGYLTQSESGNYYISHKLDNFVWIDETTIGEYTGLKDKNGTKIFEGDKVMFDYEWTKSSEVGVITWNKENSSFQIKGHIPSSSMKHLDRMKVIGNIYDESDVK